MQLWYPACAITGCAAMRDRPRYWLPAMSDVDFDIDGLWPYNFCLGEVQCALGTKMLERIEAINHERARRAERFMKALERYPELSFQHVPEGCGHSFFGICSRHVTTVMGPAHRAMNCSTYWRSPQVSRRLFNTIRFTAIRCSRRRDSVRPIAQKPIAFSTTWCHSRFTSGCRTPSLGS